MKEEYSRTLRNSAGISPEIKDTDTCQKSVYETNGSR